MTELLLYMTELLPFDHDMKPSKTCELNCKTLNVTLPLIEKKDFVLNTYFVSKHYLGNLDRAATNN